MNFEARDHWQVLVSVLLLKAVHFYLALGDVHSQVRSVFIDAVHQLVNLGSTVPKFLLEITHVLLLGTVLPRFTHHRLVLLPLVMVVVYGAFG